MGEVVLYLLIGVLSMIGVFTVFQCVLCRTGGKRDGRNMAVLVFFQDRNENVESIVRDLDAERKWSCMGEECRLFLIDCGIDSETKRLCELCCQNYPETYFCVPEEIKNYFSGPERAGGGRL